MQFTSPNKDICSVICSKYQSRYCQKEGSLSNRAYRNDNQYGYALFRDELKAQENCNPDILIEQEGKDNNPHKTKYVDNKILSNGGRVLNFVKKSTRFKKSREDIYNFEKTSDNFKNSLF